VRRSELRRKKISSRISGRSVPKENSMRDVVFILLTLAIFAIFALIVKGVERM
jgi:hypothetical protein